MDDYAGRVLADRYRLPLPPSDGYELAETRAFDTYSGQEVLVRQVPLPEIVDAEVLDADGRAPVSGRAGGRAVRRSTDPAVRRAIEAAQAAAQVPDHPRLDQVFDVFAEADSLWIVSELVAARPLAALLAEHPSPPTAPPRSAPTCSPPCGCCTPTAGPTATSPCARSWCATTAASCSPASRRAPPRRPSADTPPHRCPTPIRWPVRRWPVRRRPASRPSLPPRRVSSAAATRSRRPGATRAFRSTRALRSTQTSRSTRTSRSSPITAAATGTAAGRSTAAGSCPFRRCRRDTRRPVRTTGATRTTRTTCRRAATTPTPSRGRGPTGRDRPATRRPRRPLHSRTALPSRAPRAPPSCGLPAPGAIAAYRAGARGRRPGQRGPPAGRPRAGRPHEAAAGRTRSRPGSRSHRRHRSRRSR